jgi:acetyltransferase-like isoleucine patch superfamily enzyme
LLKRILYQIANKINLYPTAYKNRQLIKKGLLSIGTGSYGQPKIDQYKGSEATVAIGNFTSMGPGVRFIAGGIHPVDSISQYPFRSKFNLKGKYQDGNPYTKGDITVGSDVWIGTDVIILSGIRIGHGSVISAGSIVTKDVPDFGIISGIPGTLRSKRFSEKQIEELLKIAWWHWPIEKVLSEVVNLTSHNIDGFISSNRK